MKNNDNLIEHQALHHTPMSVSTCPGIAEIIWRQTDRQTDSTRFSLVNDQCENRLLVLSLWLLTAYLLVLAQFVRF